MAGNLEGWTHLSGLTVGGVVVGNSVALSASSYSAGTPMYNLSSLTVGVVAITAVATKSTETTAAFPGLAVGDAVIVNPSTISDGIVLTGYASAANVVTLRYSNVSAANAALTANVVRVTRLAF